MPTALRRFAMSVHRPRNAVLAAAVIVAVPLCLVATPSATASGAGVTGYQIVVGTPTAVQPGQSYEQADVNCPSGQSAVSGGARSDSPLINVEVSQPKTGLTGWTTSFATANTTTTTFHATAYAVCVDTPSIPGVHVVAGATVDVPPNTVATQTLTCPAHEGALSGGYAFDFESFPATSESRPRTIGIWETTVSYNTPFNNTGHLQSSVVCAPIADFADYSIFFATSNDPSTLFTTAVPGMPNAKTNTHTSHTCDSGDLAIGGGAVISDANHAWISSLYPSSSTSWTETATDTAPSSGAWTGADVLCVSGTLAITPTTTTLVVAPNPPGFDQLTTLTATVTPQSGSGVPTGTVTFLDNGNPIGSAQVDTSGKAQISLRFGPGPHSLTASYGGDTHFGPSTSAPPVTFTIACTRTITGPTASVTVTSGLTCVTGLVRGGISVARGASLDLENATVQGSLSTNGAAGLRICGSTTQALTVSGSTGFVMVGDPGNGCAPNTIVGTLLATGNTGGGDVTDNEITGSTMFTNNSPAWQVVGNHP